MDVVVVGGGGEAAKDIYVAIDYASERDGVGSHKVGPLHLEICH